jgi:hypothetical protein
MVSLSFWGQELAEKRLPLILEMGEEELPFSFRLFL